MTKKKEATIYDLKLHEKFQVDGRLIVMKVPGGWNYIDVINGLAVTTTFVPYNNEFKESEGYNTLRGVLRDDE